MGGDAPHEVEFKARDVGSQMMAEGFASALVVSVLTGRWSGDSLVVRLFLHLHTPSLG